MKTESLLKEKIFSTGLFIILGAVTIIMTIFLIAQIFYGPLGSKPAPNLVLALFVLFFLATTANFSYLTIILTDQGISAFYGLFGKTLKWSDIKDCETDEKGYFYGYGIRLGRYKGQWLWVYNVIGGKRVAFQTKGKKPLGMIISTRKSDEIIRLANEHIKGN